MVTLPHALMDSYILPTQFLVDYYVYVYVQCV